MTSAVPRRQVLVIGLDPFRVPGPWDPEPVANAIETGMAGLADRGIDAESCLVGIDEDDDVPTRISEALRSRRWDCVVVGGGIRNSEELVELFESVVNLVRRHAPQAEIAFNSSPENLFEAVARRLQLG